MEALPRGAKRSLRPLARPLTRRIGVCLVNGRRATHPIRSRVHPVARPGLEAVPDRLRPGGRRYVRRAVVLVVPTHTRSADGGGSQGAIREYVAAITRVGSQSSLWARRRDLLYDLGAYAHALDVSHGFLKIQRLERQYWVGYCGEPPFAHEFVSPGGHRRVSCGTAAVFTASRKYTPFFDRWL